MKTAIFLAIALLVEIKYRPRFGYTEKGNVLLWHGVKKRNYIKIW